MNRTTGGGPSRGPLLAVLVANGERYRCCIGSWVGRAPRRVRPAVGSTNPARVHKDRVACSERDRVRDVRAGVGAFRDRAGNRRVEPFFCTTSVVALADARGEVNREVTDCTRLDHRSRRLLCIQAHVEPAEPEVAGKATTDDSGSRRPGSTCATGCSGCAFDAGRTGGSGSSGRSGRPGRSGSSGSSGRSRRAVRTVGSGRPGCPGRPGWAGRAVGSGRPGWAGRSVGTAGAFGSGRPGCALRSGGSRDSLRSGGSGFAFRSGGSGRARSGRSGGSGCSGRAFSACRLQAPSAPSARWARWAFGFLRLLRLLRLGRAA